MNRADNWWEIPDLPQGSRILDLGAGGPAVSLRLPDRSGTTFLTNDIRLHRIARSADLNSQLITDIPDVGTFDRVVYEPLQRETKLRVFEMIDGGFRALSQGGRFFLAGRKNRGVESYKNRLGDVFGNVNLVGRARRVRLYEAVKSTRTPGAAPVDPWSAFTSGGGTSAELNFRIRAGVFSSNGFDPGSRFLADTVRTIAAERILDVGCGAGTIGVALAAGDPKASLSMVDVSTLAIDCAEQNARNNGLGDRSVTVLGDLYDAFADQQFDLIVSNPPFHEGNVVSHPLVEEAPGHLSLGGSLVLVVMRLDPYVKILNQVFGKVDVLARDKAYSIR